MRLIDADALMEDVTKVKYFRKIQAKRIIDAQPTIDAIPVVRCKDCKHRPTIDGKWENGFDVIFPDGRCPCQCEDGWYNWMPRDDWFCGNGERKEE